MERMGKAEGCVELWRSPHSYRFVSNEITHPIVVRRSDFPQIRRGQHVSLWVSRGWGHCFCYLGKKMCLICL